MHVVHTFADLTASYRDVCVAIGVFDGVHLGHQRVINRARDAARTSQAATVVLTFDPHPVRVLAPDKAPPLLTATTHKLRLIAGLDVAACLVLPFTREFAQTPPAAFIATLARELPGLRRICVGSRFRFGHNRAGDVALIAQLAPRYGFVAEEVPSALLGGEMISSTALRRLIVGGELDRAAAMLGRRFSVLGRVVRGAQLGRQLGFPTANVDPHNEVLPPDGVYAIRARTGGRTLPGMANIGIRPTLDKPPPARRLEAHLFEFAGDLYDAEIEVEFAGLLRAEQKFDSLPALQAQLARDQAAARQLLASLPA